MSKVREILKFNPKSEPVIHKKELCGHLQGKKKHLLIFTLKNSPTNRVKQNIYKINRKTYPTDILKFLHQQILI